MGYRLTSNPNILFELVIIICCVVLGLSACYPTQSQVNLGDTPLIYDPDLVNQQDSNPVIALCYQPATSFLFSVHDGSGKLYIWDLNTDQMIDSYDLMLKETPILRFTQNCQKIISAPEVETRTGRHGVDFNYFDKIFVWDVSSGTLDQCIGDCEDRYTYPTQIGYILNETTGSEIYYDETSYSWHRNKAWDWDSTNFVRGGDETRPTIAQIKFLPASDQFAIAYLEGDVSIGGRFFLFSQYWVEKNSTDEKKVVSGFDVDPTGKYITRIMDGELSIWRINIIHSKKLLMTEVGENDQVNFTPSGEYLVVYGKEGAKIWDIKGLTVIHEVDLPNLTSFFMTSAECIFFGDQTGTIHRVRLQPGIE